MLNILIVIPLFAWITHVFICEMMGNEMIGESSVEEFLITLSIFYIVFFYRKIRKRG